MNVHGKLETRVSKLLDIRYPVILAPMGNVSGGRLATAVSAAGGLGLIGGGYGDSRWLEREFDYASGQRVGVGFITWSLTRQPELLDLALARRPVAVMLSFGDVQPFAAKIREAHAFLICQIQCVEDARSAADAGADIIVAQGAEAGGHGASRSTFTLVPAVSDAVAPIPVVAAGGIADGRGLAAALMLGAEGALVGTRFFASEEALGHTAAKQRIVEAKGDDTLRTSVFDVVRGIDWPARFTGRAIGNRFSAAWHGRDDELRANLGYEQSRYRNAADTGDANVAVTFAGENVDLIGEVLPARSIVERMVGQATAMLDGADDRSRVGSWQRRVGCKSETAGTGREKRVQV